MNTTAARSDGLLAAAKATDFRALMALTKPTISMLVVVTTLPAMLLAQKGIPSIRLLLATALGTYLASASAAVLNHIVETQTDSQMKRTRHRPMPTGRVKKRDGIFFSLLLATISSIILYTQASPLAAVLAISANIFYVLIYTKWLKPHTAQNIVIGGAAGAIGPLIGWASVTGTLSQDAWVMFAIIFLWTPPHFWALALKYKKDYAKANIPMYPVVYGDEATRKKIFQYSLTLLPTIFLLWNACAWPFFVIAIPATMYFVYLTYLLYRAKDNGTCMQVFRYSCLYLFFVFGAIGADVLLLGL